MDELTTAWSSTDSCGSDLGQSGATNATVGGPAPYWESWAFDADGDRVTATDHAVPGLTGAGTGPSTTTTTSTDYAYPTTTNSAGATVPGAQPHTLSQTSTTEGSSSTSTSYGYDADGDETSMSGPDGDQSLTWDDQGNLSSDTTSTGATSYVYDADGNLLLREDPGTSTLFLPDEQLVLDTGTSAVTGTRYYDLPDGTTAVRTGSANSDFDYEIDGLHGTSTMLMPSDGSSISYRYFDPYGNARGGSESGSGIQWPDDHTFLGDPDDTTTGLVDIGAREYDPTTGRFITDDPELEIDSPQELNGYSYAAGNPITGEDPTGQDFIDEGNGCVGTLQACSKAGAGPDRLGHVGGGTGSGGGDSDGSSSSSSGSHGGHKGTASEGESKPNTPGCSAKAYWLGSCDQEVEATYQTLHSSCSGECLGAAVLGMLVCGPFSEFCDAAGGFLLTGAGEFALPALDGTTEALGGLGGLLGRLLSPGDDAEGATISCPNSFTAGTPVLVADSRTKPIQDVQVGDKITNALPGATTQQTHTVTAVHVTHTDHHFNHLTVGDGDGKTALIDVTAGHLFYDATTSKWTPAWLIKPGDHLQTTPGHTATVATNAPDTTTTTTYNLTIDGLHTYYVLAGGVPILVHNAKEPCGVDPYQVGTYSELKRASKPGDGLDLHHVPQGKPAGQAIPGYDYPNAPAIALPRAEHAQIPIAQDLENLANLTNTPQSSIDELTRRIDQQYPGAR